MFGLLLLYLLQVTTPPIRFECFGHKLSKSNPGGWETRLHTLASGWRDVGVKFKASIVKFS